MPGRSWGRGPRRMRGVPVARNGRGVPALVIEEPVPTLSVPGWLQALVAVFRLALTGITTAVGAAYRFPFTAAGLVLALAVWQSHAAALVAVLVFLVALGGIGLAWKRPDLFTAWVLAPSDRYRRARRLSRTWARLCRLCDLHVVEVDPGSGERVIWTPRLSRLRWAKPTRVALTGAVRVLPGQTVDDLVDAAPRLASAAGARSCRVTATGPNTATVAFLFGDPLTKPIPLQPLTDPAGGPSGDGRVDLGAVPIGMGELGRTWRLRLAGSHVLIAGATGAGKSGVVWSLLRGVAGHVRDGLVQVWAIDGKGGIELTAGRPMFTRFATTVPDGLTLLTDAVELMQTRAVELAGHTRSHTPTRRHPLVVVLIDEVALLTAYEPDRKRRDAALAALSLLTTQGRALGFVVVAALQDPRQNVIGIRHLFPTRIGLRLDSEGETQMVLGDAAVKLGAACHTIPEAMAGVAYVKVDGQREPLRVRASWMDDDAVRTLATDHPTPTRTRPAGTAAQLAPVQDTPQDSPAPDARVTEADWSALQAFLNDSTRPSGEHGQGDAA